MKVLKFGGTSVGSAQNIVKVTEIIKKISKEETFTAVVVSAFGDTSDLLIETAVNASNRQTVYREMFNYISEMHIEVIDGLMDYSESQEIKKQIGLLLEELGEILDGVYKLRELSSKTLGFVLSFGERISASIISMYMQKKGIDVFYADSRDFIITDDNYGNALVDFDKTEKKLTKYFKDKKGIAIVTGFIAKTVNSHTTTLGRGGSDYTAAILGSVLNAEEIQLWKDVDGVMSANPKRVSKAFPIESLSYIEAMELSHFGAKIIHPPTIQPALLKKIPIRIMNTLNPDFKGTLIYDIVQESQTSHIIKGITSIDDITLIRIQGSGMIGVSGISSRLFTSLAVHKINIVMITQASSEHSICIAVMPNEAAKAKTIIEKEFALEINTKLVDGVVVEDELSIIAVVGERMRFTPGLSANLFKALGINGINVIAIAQGSSELNISVVITKKDIEKALNAVHDAFFLSDTRTLNLFVLGYSGLVGSTLISQIKAQHEKIFKGMKLDLKLIGLANSKSMIFNEHNNTKEKKSDLKDFVTEMKKMNLPNSVFVDCTALPDVYELYSEILCSSISIVTPNKTGASGPYKNYKKLKELASQHNTHYIYETNVGAGLPVINTLNDLLNSGDKLDKVEGILSGTISYILSSFVEGSKFSDIVKEAKRLGYTEPDPRVDLSGADFAKKILILARENGANIEISQVDIQKMLPEACFKESSVDEFFVELEKHDQYFEDLRLEAAKKDCVLRYIATYEKGRASISLKSVDNSHPFYFMKGSDNIVAFTTERYSQTPMVIKGPGAGAEVTAAGVLADIIRIANYA